MSSFYKKKDTNIHSYGVDNLGRKHKYRIGSNIRLVKRDGTKEYNKWSENNNKTLSIAILEKERLETKYKCSFIIVEKKSSKSYRVFPDPDDKNHKKIFINYEYEPNEEFNVLN